MELALADGDLLAEILLRLPVKSLIRFKSVCKKWLSFISSDYFCHKHTLRRPKLQQSLILRTNIPPLFYFNPSSNAERVVMKPYSLSVPDHHILQACNGLMLLGSNQLKNSYYVYNPTTRRSRKISLTKTNADKYPYVATINLAFDPSSSPHYKIVCIRSTTDVDPESFDPDVEEYTYQIEVYDSESHTWKLSLEPFVYNGYILFHSHGVHWNNAIYWDSVDDCYCYFDIAKDEMKALCCPQTPQHDDDDYQGIKIVLRRLQELNGHLFHYELMDESQRTSVSLWEFQGDGNHQPRWLQKHNQVIDRVSILRLMGGEGAYNLLIHRLRDPTGEIKTYNFIDESYEELLDVTNEPFYKPDDKGFHLIAFPFGEILALV